MLGMALTSCTPQKPPAPKIEGVWLYEAPVAKEQVFGGGTVVTERIHLKLTPDGKVSLKWSEGGSEVGFVEGSIQGDWKQEGDLLVMTNPDSSFGVFRIVAVEQAELRVLTRQGKLYRLTRMPD
jgi:hypothetical protein